MFVTIEYFGVPRQKTGVSSDSLSFVNSPTLLSDVLTEIARQHTAFGDQCLTGDQLSRETIINLNGDEFIRSLDTQVVNGDHILILSTDAGG
jgi:molybdopterin converting factor small subunit